MSPSSVERTTWARAASGWTQHAARLATMTRPATEALFVALEPTRGEHILDVAAGVGDPSLELCRAVGPAGRVIAVDGAHDMLAGLVGRAPRELRPRVAVACAEELPFLAATFDGVTCRFGAMFFDDPRGGLSEMRRVLRPGGRVVLVVWGRKERNPYFTVVVRGLQAAGVVIPDPAPGTHTVFEHADVAAFTDLARDAGFARAAITVVPFVMRLPGVRPEELLDVQREMSGRIAELTADVDAEVLARACAWVADEVAPHSAVDGLAMPAECNVLRAE